MQVNSFICTLGNQYTQTFWKENFEGTISCSVEGIATVGLHGM